MDETTLLLLMSTIVGLPALGSLVLVLGVIRSRRGPPPEGG